MIDRVIFGIGTLQAIYLYSKGQQTRVIKKATWQEWALPLRQQCDLYAFSKAQWWCDSVQEDRGLLSSSGKTQPCPLSLSFSSLWNPLWSTSSRRSRWPFPPQQAVGCWQRRWHTVIPYHQPMTAQTTFRRRYPVSRVWLAASDELSCGSCQEEGL